MLPKKILLYLIPVLFLFSSFGYSQIITSKKDAVKKGTYISPAEKKNSNKKTKTIGSTDLKKSTKANISEKNEEDLMPTTSSENYLAVQLINNAMEFIGVKYRYGGTSLMGMDCSGMITAVFNVFDLKLPRTSIDMSKIGEKLELKDIQKGDLIFFKTSGLSIINHVGIVIEVVNDEIKFIHASSSDGVRISSTKEPYYKRAFAQVNRVL
jgi:cell wall-associated NlpC family hydrolase